MSRAYQFYTQYCSNSPVDSLQIIKLPEVDYTEHIHPLPVFGYRNYEELSDDIKNWLEIQVDIEELAQFVSQPLFEIITDTLLAFYESFYNEYSDEEELKTMYADADDVVALRVQSLLQVILITLIVDTFPEYEPNLPDVDSSIPPVFTFFYNTPYHTALSACAYYTIWTCLVPLWLEKKIKELRADKTDPMYKILSLKFSSKKSVTFNAMCEYIREKIDTE